MTASATIAADIIKKHAPNFTPKLAITLGSGLGVLAESLEEATTIPYDELPDFPPCTVAGHGGALHLGKLNGLPVACLQGRAHFYEGVSNTVASTYIRTMKLLGCESILITNASGSMREAVTPGNLVIIKDHINFQFTNVLHGPNDDNFGPRFVGMEDAYNTKMRDQLKKIAASLNVPITEGVYFGVLGPTFETPSEIKAFRTLGGDVVGMSTLNEVITAHHCGLKLAVVAVITNMAAGMSHEKLSHELTLKGASVATERLKNLVMGFVDQYESAAVV